MATSTIKTPWHLWLVGILALLWNGMGMVTILMAQAGKIPNIDPEEAIYYATQSWLLVIITDLTLVIAVAASVALLFRSQLAVGLFALSFALLLLSNINDLAFGTSRALVGSGAMAMTLIIVVIAVLELLYAYYMRKRQVLK